MVTRILVGAILMGIFGSTGCLSAGAGSLPSITVEMLPGNQYVVEERSVPENELVRALKAAGAGRKTRVQMVTPAGIPPASLKGVAFTLSKAGYRKVHFTTPRRATASVKGESPQ